MDTGLIRALKIAGSITMDDLVTRVSASPEAVLDDLEQLKHRGYIEVDGPRSVPDLRQAIEAAARESLPTTGTKPGDLEGEDAQRRAIAQALMRDRDFRKTRISLSKSGFRGAFAL